MPSKKRAAGRGLPEQVRQIKTHSAEHPESGDDIVTRSGLKHLPRGTREPLDDLLQAASNGQHPSRSDLDAVESKLDPQLSGVRRRQLMSELSDHADALADMYRAGARGPARAEARALVHDYSQHLDRRADNSDPDADLDGRAIAAKVWSRPTGL